MTAHQYYLYGLMERRRFRRGPAVRASPVQLRSASPRQALGQPWMAKPRISALQAPRQRSPDSGKALQSKTRPAAFSPQRRLCPHLQPGAVTPALQAAARGPALPLPPAWLPEQRELKKREPAQPGWTALPREPPRTAALVLRAAAASPGRGSGPRSPRQPCALICPRGAGR